MRRARGVRKCRSSPRTPWGRVVVTVAGISQRDVHTGSPMQQHEWCEAISGGGVARRDRHILTVPACHRHTPVTSVDQRAEQR